MILTATKNIVVWYDKRMVSVCPCNMIDTESKKSPVWLARLSARTLQSIPIHNASSHRNVRQVKTSGKIKLKIYLSMNRVKIVTTAANNCYVEQWLMKGAAWRVGDRSTNFNFHKFFQKSRSTTCYDDI